MLVRDVMTRRPVTIRAGSSLKAALEVLADHAVTALPVIDARGCIRGVVSEADLIRELVPPPGGEHEDAVTASTSLQVTDVMSRHPVTVTPTTELAVAVELLTSTTVKSVPVVAPDGRVVGVLSRADVVRVLARPDHQLHRSVRLVLDDLGLQDWMVEVRDGIVQLDGPDGGPEPAVARIAAARVPGVLGVDHRQRAGEARR